MDLVNFLSDKAFSVPLWQIGSIILINLFCLLAGKYRSGLLVSSFSMLYWGFILNKTYFVETLGLFLYIAAGLIMVVMLMIGLFVEDER
jgi:hypothetical protein